MRINLVTSNINIQSVFLNLVFETTIFNTVVEDFRSAFDGACLYSSTLVSIENLYS